VEEVPPVPDGDVLLKVSSVLGTMLPAVSAPMAPEKVMALIALPLAGGRAAVRAPCRLSALSGFVSRPQKTRERFADNRLELSFLGMRPYFQGPQR
jgi:hypothetical protein